MSVTVMRRKDGSYCWCLRSKREAGVERISVTSGSAAGVFQILVVLAAAARISASLGPWYFWLAAATALATARPIDRLRTSATRSWMKLATCAAFICARILKSVPAVCSSVVSARVMARRPMKQMGMMITIIAISSLKAGMRISNRSAAMAILLLNRSSQCTNLTLPAARAALRRAGRGGAAPGAHHPCEEEDSREDGARLVAREGAAARGHLVQDHTKTEQVCSRVDILGPHLLRRHV